MRWHRLFGRRRMLRLSGPDRRGMRFSGVCRGGVRFAGMPRSAVGLSGMSRGSSAGRCRRRGTRGRWCGTRGRWRVWRCRSVLWRRFSFFLLLFFVGAAGLRLGYLQGTWDRLRESGARLNQQHGRHHCTRKYDFSYRFHLGPRKKSIDDLTCAKNLSSGWHDSHWTFAFLLGP
jgi:hypothetical protein